jgi:hypothetical protein
MNAHITYKELLGVLQKMSESELQQTLTIKDVGVDEIYPVECVIVTGVEENRLDEGHFVLAFNIPFADSVYEL